MSLLKVLLCVHQFYPRFFTGTEALTLSVAEELRQRGHDVAILTAELDNSDEAMPDIIASGFDAVKSNGGPVLLKDIYHGLPVWRIFMTTAQDPLERMAKEARGVPVAAMGRDANI